MNKNDREFEVHEVKDNNSIYNVDITQNPSNDNAGITAFVLSLFAYFVYIFCFITSGGSQSELGDGMVWGLFALYVVVGEIPITIASIIFAIKGLKGKNRLFSILSFGLNLAKLPLIILIT